LPSLGYTDKNAECATIQCDQITRRFIGEFIVKSFVIFILTLSAICFVPYSSFAADETRQEVVAEHGAGVMPFDLKATTHIFTKIKMGGIQQVVVKNPADATQIALIRKHLKKIAAQFSRGDFSDPSRIHGTEMPGLAELNAAQPGEIKIQYRKLNMGAEIIYTAKNPKLVEALHKWFDAQLADHGKDAMAGHDHSMMHPQ
jgi:hypothetical protein